MSRLRRIRPSRLVAAAAAAVPASLVLAPSAWAQAVDSKPAGGAETAQVIGATAGAVVATAVLLFLAAGHRSGRIKVVGRLADFASRWTGFPPWAALPTEILMISLVTALFGMYWDISLHIDDGRDAGPLANPAHYFILAGLFGAFAAGVLACALPVGRPSRASVKLGKDWYAPVGGVILVATSAFSLAGFPLDDFWHRIFGQDVTLWGPTHLMLIGGAGLGLIAHATLLVEGGRPSRPHEGPLARRGPLWLLAQTRYAGVCGGLLIGLSTFQAEFDFGVPQFRLVFEPVLLAVAAGIALVTARIYAGRGGALIAAAYFIVIRGVLALIVGPGLGEATPHLPLYLAEAAVVEAAAFALAPRTRPYAFGAAAGALIGTVGFAAEFAWSHVWMPVAWPASLIEEALPVVPVAAVAAGLIGGFVGSALTAPRKPGVRVPRVAPAALGVAAIVVVFAYGLQTSPEQGVRASVELRDVQSGPERTVAADIRVDPASATDDADYVSVIAWQGKGFVLDDLERTGPGRYRTTEPIPAHGTWKTLIRLHRKDSLIAVPVHLPEDTAIPAPAVPARDRFTRSFVEEREILQRELKDDVPAGLPALAYTVVGAIALSLLVLLGWALSRLGHAARPPHETPTPPTPARAALPLGA
jgi:hypothetical protein